MAQPDLTRAKPYKEFLQDQVNLSGCRHAQLAKEMIEEAERLRIGEIQLWCFVNWKQSSAEYREHILRSAGIKVSINHQFANYSPKVQIAIGREIFRQYKFSKITNAIVQEVRV